MYLIFFIFPLQCRSKISIFIIHSIMLKGAEKDELEYLQKPRKLIKINVREDQNYDEFKGGFIDEATQPTMRRQTKVEAELTFTDIEAENSRNQDIFDFIKSNTATHLHRKIRSIGDASKPDVVPAKSTPKVEASTKVKLEEKAGTTDPKVTLEGKNKSVDVKPKQPKKKINANGLSNWQKFISNPPVTQNQVKKEVKSKGNDQFIAIDCEFVKSNEQELLARISLINEKGQCRLDTYVHPDKKITDYVSDISGITYGHIKNAPNIKTVIDNVKNILYNKIVVGHTVWKDLEVCGLKDWKGCKAVVDICEYSDFKEKSGKLISLKNLSAKFLGKKIQEGRHSSTEDAQATMSLFLLKKKEILKHYRLIV